MESQPLQADGGKTFTAAPAISAASDARKMPEFGSECPLLTADGAPVQFPPSGVRSDPLLRPVVPELLAPAVNLLITALPA